MCAPHAGVSAAEGGRPHTTSIVRGGFHGRHTPRLVGRRLAAARRVADTAAAAVAAIPQPRSRSEDARAARGGEATAAALEYSGERDGSRPLPRRVPSSSRWCLRGARGAAPACIQTPRGRRCRAAARRHPPHRRPSPHPQCSDRMAAMAAAVAAAPPVAAAACQHPQSRRDCGVRVALLPRHGHVGVRRLTPTRRRSSRHCCHAGSVDRRRATSAPCGSGTTMPGGIAAAATGGDRGTAVNPHGLLHTTVLVRRRGLGKQGGSGGTGVESVGGLPLVWTAWTGLERQWAPGRGRWWCCSFWLDCFSVGQPWL